jgi:hypothetical protein
VPGRVSGYAERLLLPLTHFIPVDPEVVATIVYFEDHPCYPVKGTLHLSAVCPPSLLGDNCLLRRFLTPMQALRICACPAGEFGSSQFLISTAALPRIVDELLVSS